MHVMAWCIRNKCVPLRAKHEYIMRLRRITPPIALLAALAVSIAAAAHQPAVSAPSATDSLTTDTTKCDTVLVVKIDYSQRITTGFGD